jgi:hypothetical protein
LRALRVLRFLLQGGLVAGTRRHGDAAGHPRSPWSPERKASSRLLRSVKKPARLPP